MYDNTGTIECRIVMWHVFLFTCGIKAHPLVIYTGSDKSWNGKGGRHYDPLGVNKIICA